MARPAPLRRRRAAALLACAAAWLAAGCTVIAGREGISYRNLPNVNTPMHLPATPVPRASSLRAPQKDVFVGVALSGGGSRSANFGLAVLAELQALGLLEQVDAVSAVSGGTIPAVWFALHGSEPDWAERGREAVGSDLLMPLIGRLLNPLNIVATTFTDRDRSDTMAEIFEDRFFGGRRITYGDLGARGPMRPSLYLNATDSTNGGTRFVFTDEAFVRQIGSDLSRYPLAWAMAASAAFPGVFNSVTLRRWPIGESGRGEARYLHLIDGGVSDNLGTQTLIEQARAHHIAALRAGREPRGCFIVVVDSHVPGTSQAESLQSDRRNGASMLIDLNFIDAIDGMLSNRRDESLAALGIRPDQPNAWFSIDLGQGQIEYDVRPYRRIGTFPVSYYVIDGLPVPSPVLTVQRDMLSLADAQHASQHQFSCTAWHVSLRDIHSIVPWREAEGAWRPLDPAAAADQPAIAARARLARLIEQVSTSHRLSGPPDCPPARVQQALFDAARIAVREDKPSLDEVCAWFAQRGLAGGARCRAEREPLQPANADLLPITPPRDRGIVDQQANRYVRCPAETRELENR